MKRGRLWRLEIDVTPQIVCDANFEAGLLAFRPEDAAPSSIVRIHVKPSPIDGCMHLTVFGRERPFEEFDGA